MLYYILPFLNQVIFCWIKRNKLIFNIQNIFHVLRINVIFTINTVQGVPHSVTIQVTCFTIVSMLTVSHPVELYQQ